MTRYSKAELDHARASEEWWAIAPNPSCPPWCTASHDPHDFQINGALVCQRSIGSRVSVLAMRHAGTEPGTTRTVEPPTIEVDSPADLDADGALQLAADLRRAAIYLGSTR